MTQPVKVPFCADVETGLADTMRQIGRPAKADGMLPETATGAGGNSCTGTGSVVVKTPGAIAMKASRSVVISGTAVYPPAGQPKFLQGAAQPRLEGKRPSLP